MLNIVKLNVLNKNFSPNRSDNVKSLKLFPSSVREWNNSIYVYNENGLDLVHHATLSAVNIIRSYFSLYNYKLERKIRTKRLSRRFRRLSLNKIYISNGEFKHTNNKVIINLYLFNRQKYNYISSIKKLCLKAKLNIKNKVKFKFKDITVKNKFNSFILEKNRLNNYKARSTKINKYVSKDIRSKMKTLNNVKIHDYKPVESRLRKIKNRLANVKFNIYKNSKLLFTDRFFYNKFKSINVFETKKNHNIELDIFKLYNNFFLKLINRNINFRTTKLNSINFSKCALKYKINKYVNKDETFKYELNLKINKPSIKNIITKYKSKRAKNIYIKTAQDRYKVKITNYINSHKKSNYKPKVAFRKLLFFKNLKKRINIIKRKNFLLLLKLINKEKYLIINNLTQDKNMYFYISAYIRKFYKNFFRKSLRKLKLYFYYRQLLYINKSKYNYNYLQYLNKYLSSLYNKNVEYNLINLKRFHLHSNILSESITLKITRNRKGLVRKLKSLLKKLERRVEKYKAFAIKKINRKKRKTNWKILNYKNLPIIKNKLKKWKIIENIKHKYITGFRLEAKGRLTRRYKASKSLSKNKYKGSLSNISPLNIKNNKQINLSFVLLKGNLKSNLQYTKLKSKSRIGSFGIKGWVSGN